MIKFCSNAFELKMNNLHTFIYAYNQITEYLLDETRKTYLKKKKDNQIRDLTHNTLTNVKKQYSK